jgi:hypothetical protein
LEVETHKEQWEQEQSATYRENEQFGSVASSLSLIDAFHHARAVSVYCPCTQRGLKFQVQLSVVRFGSIESIDVITTLGGGFENGWVFENSKYLPLLSLPLASRNWC